MSELTQEEQEVLQELSQENQKASEGQYEEDYVIQRNIIAMLATDGYFLIQSMGLIKPGYFINEAHQLIAKIVFNYFEKYKQLPPKQFMAQEIEDEIKNRKAEIKQYFRTEFNVIFDYYVVGAEDREFLLDRITNFAKAQGLKDAFKKCLDELKQNKDQNTWLKIHDTLRNALIISRDAADVGLDYFQTFEERYATMLQQQEQGEIFTCCFKAIDDALVGGGLSKGELGSWMGTPGSGKSVILVAVALANIHLGKKVLYVSLEMDEYKVAERFDAQFANMGNEGKVTINTLVENKEIVFESLRNYIKECEDPRLLIVKQFPAGQMDVAAFRAYIAQVKLHGFHPDLVILDYVGEMKDFTGMPTWESRNKIVRDLRGIAVEEDICIFTAMQPDRRARDQSNEQKELGFIDDSNLADAYGQSRPVDALWSINQFQDEKDCGLARIFVVKHRHGKSRFTFHVEFDYNTLRVSQISNSAYEKRIKEYRNSKLVQAKENTEKKIKDHNMSDDIDRICRIPDAGEHLKALQDTIKEGE